MNKDALKTAKKLLPLYQQHVEPWADQARQIASCKRGCNHCCYMLIGSTLSEGALIASKLMESPVWMRELRELRARLEDDVAEIRALPKDKTHHWMVKKKGCPFLDKQSGDCRIYDVRPTACRTYFVTSDPEQCSPERPGARVLIIDPRPATTPFIEDIITKTVDHIPPLTGSLQSMVLAGMELISHSSGHFARWTKSHPTDDMLEPGSAAFVNPGELAER